MRIHENPYSHVVADFFFFIVVQRKREIPLRKCHLTDHRVGTDGSMGSALVIVMTKKENSVANKFSFSSVRRENVLFLI